MQLENFDPADPTNSLTQNRLLGTEFLGWEAMAMLTIKSLWGGAYEIASFFQGRFQKMDNMVFAISVDKYSPTTNEIQIQK